MTVFSTKGARPSTRRGLRYKDKNLQQWWLSSIKEEILDCGKTIEFFEAFIMKHFHERAISELANEILNYAKDRKRYLEKSLEFGDYPDE